MPRLLDFFRPLFLFGLALDTTIQSIRTHTQLDDARQHVLHLLERARARATAAGHAPGHVESASFALVAWLDEILARNPLWSPGSTPLQVQLFNSNNAQTEFFHHLSALQADDAQLREVYWHVLVHGFTGQYYFEAGDSGELGKLKTLHGQQLPMPPLALATLAGDHITPQPYSLPSPVARQPPERRQRALLLTGAAIALLLPLLNLLWLLLDGSHPPPSTLAQRVEQLLQSYTCADLSATVSASGVAEVRGFVSLPDDLQRVPAQVAALPDVKSTNASLALRAWPYCEVVAMLKPYQARNRDKQSGLTLGIQGAREGRLREGDPVLVQVTQANFDGYLWVDYYTADGSVLHFNAGRNARRLSAGERVELGQDIPSSWLVSPPFGTVLVAALASSAAFHENADRPPYELASDYLLRLRESLAANKDPERLVAEFAFLQTVER
jgi:type IV/VI secretion system ImpK/VasF family protein